MVSDTDLDNLYSDLKKGNSNGIEMDSIELYSTALNYGFAEKGRIKVYGRKLSIMLSTEGRKYDTYQQYKDRDKSIQNININAPIIGSQIGQSSDFGNLELSHNSIALDTLRHNAQPKDEAKTISKKESICKKIYKWTDHKLISILVYGILFFITKFIWDYLNLPKFW